jgi:hypothetical protein
MADPWSSEDALSWNIFVGGLAELAKLLSGRESAGEPELYLWGNHVNGARPEFWQRLRRVQRELDRGKAVATEPDVILRVPDDVIIVIEAKFGSPDSLFEKKEKRVGPVADYLQRYTGKVGAADPLSREWIYAQHAGILEQLCRNAIYTHWLADRGERQVLVNLVRADWEADVMTRFCNHLVPGTVEFRRVTWEDIFSLPALYLSTAAEVLKLYVHNKTLRLQKAFQEAA